MTYSLDHHAEICVADMGAVTIHTVCAIQDLLGSIASLDREIRLVSPFEDHLHKASMIDLEYQHQHLHHN